MAGICPHCKKTVLTLAASLAALRSPNGTIKTITYTCSFCLKILGVSLDPYSLVDEILRKMKHS